VKRRNSRSATTPGTITMLAARLFINAGGMRSWVFDDYA
jgi:hypothetical protein